MRSSIALAILACALLGGSATACTTTAEPAPTIDWSPCAQHPDVECASVRVPIDWARPDGDSIEMAVARRTATDPAHRIGSLISMPGGPGSSGVDDLLAAPKFSPELNSRFDVVSFDPRGVGRSHPVTCDAGLAATMPNVVPDKGARLDDVQSYAKKLAASCRARTGPLMDHLDAVSVARDIEALRRALGDDRISLYGRSYGTMPGQSYAELFPDHLRALVLDSVDDHSLDGDAFLASEARAGQDTFDQFAAWCDRDTACVLHGQDVHAVYGARAASTDLLQLSSATTQLLYKPDWPALATMFETGPVPAQPPPPVHDGGVAMPTTIVCSDWHFDISSQQQWEQLWQQQNRNAPTLRAHFAWAAGSLCSGWPTAPPNPPHVPNRPATPPVLIMNGLHDPATPYEWALGVERNTPGATLLTYDGPGHGSYPRNACTTTAADRYLIDLTVPARGSHCAAVPG
ncbi:alpha/beta hydrolase [Antrihabitans cavernicola]|nr:alpha/beta hydrolase [Spelaeibacter cavernicola]